MGNHCRCIGGPLAGYTIELTPGLTQFTAEIPPYADVKPYTGHRGSLEQFKTGLYLLKRTADGEPVYVWYGPKIVTDEGGAR